ncbi:ferrous iron transport protein B [Fusibacter sp. JL216-2]|uniref:ferrous iron transport protein B n=1 Tax=Fusibacter sp. JL216-2 TaxID=3071453 RepID=UPI003D3596D4
MSGFKVALAGNPNCGKTTLLNGLTGARHYVGNWAGVTVEKKEGTIRHKGEDITIVDLPGIYSLSPFTLEERISRQYILEDMPDMIINIVDASALERNLFLTFQLMELGRPVIIALNMMDEAEKRGIKIDVEGLSEALGLPIVPIVARKEKGLDALMDMVLDQVHSGAKLESKPIRYSEDLEQMIQGAEHVINHIPDHINKRWACIKLLERDEMLLEAYDISGIDSLPAVDEQIANEKYRLINDMMETVVKRPDESYDKLSAKLDKYILNQWIGIPIFALVMYFVFNMTFTLGGYGVDILDVFFSDHVAGFASALLMQIGVADWMQSLIVDGIIGGVGGVLTFVPNIAIMFFFISILEDSGYMARVAFIMDRWMTKVGLNGKTFIPMILGFGCNVPAIMGTRTLENENDRLIAILINPFMSCSARLPVYILFASVFFKGYESLVTYSLYVFGILVALLMAYLFRKFLFKSEETPFIMELPTYRLPIPKALFIHVWERVRGYIVKAGTVIFAASVILWVITSYNFNGPAIITESFGASIGKVIAPVFKPLGFGRWQAALSLLTGIAAKEIVVSNMAIVYGFADPEATRAFAQVLQSEFTALSAYAFMVFVLLYTPCVAVIGVIKRETNSWKWTGFSVAYQIAVAWVFAFLVYQVGRLLGF